MSQNPSIDTLVIRKLHCVPSEDSPWHCRYILNQCTARAGAVSGHSHLVAPAVTRRLWRCRYGDAIRGLYHDVG